MKRIFIITIYFLLMASGVAVAEIKIHLPREVKINSDIVRLGEISIIRGDKAGREKAEDVVLGKITVAGQDVTFDRNAIKSRLASSGMQKEGVIFTGSDKVLIKTKSSVIKSDRIIKSAESFLRRKLNDDSISRAVAARVPKEIILPENDNLELEPKLLKTSSSNRANVQLKLKRDGKVIDTINVVFNLKFKKERVVSTTSIQKGELISKKNTKIETSEVNYAPDSDAETYMGKVAKRKIRPNTILNSTLVMDAEDKILVERNDTVVVKVDSPALLISAMGQALEDGKRGDLIKVKMKISRSSQRVIYAKIIADGTLEPVF